MGYHASGQGFVVLKKEVDVNEVFKVLENLSDCDIEFEEQDNYIDFWEDNTHWDEEDTYVFLDALIPYITEGCANYSGEGDCIWRYVYYPESETWEEENARIDYNFESYTDKELITELEKRGYKVTR